MSNNNYINIDTQSNDFTIRRNRYLSVLTALICISIVSFLVVINNNNKPQEQNNLAMKFKELNFINTVAVPATLKPTKYPTAAPTDNPTPSPSTYPTTAPSSKPTISPTPSPTSTPTLKPTKLPTLTPTTKPTNVPSLAPTKPPTNLPTSAPSPLPTIKPSYTPTTAPTPNPIFAPTDYPTKAPRLHPTHPPTKNPRFSPTPAPTKTPHAVPSKKPSDWSNTYHPTLSPIFVPTTPPTKSPVYSQTSTPTKPPRFPPTHAPHPTQAPTIYSCVNSFIDSAPGNALTLYLEDPTQTGSYTTVHGTFNPGVPFKLPVWCLNYFNPIQTYYIYNNTQISSYAEVLTNPSSQNTINPNNIGALNQVTWILNNINVGDSALGATPTLDGYTFSGCTASISSSDIQAAFWYLMNYPSCPITPNSFNCPESIDIDKEGAGGYCNAAYVVSSAYSAVPAGSTFSFPNGAVDETTTVVPILFLPQGDQPLVVSATLAQWDYKCQ